MTRKREARESFGSVIVDVLHALRLTRVELAARMGVSARALQHWCYEAGPPPERTAHRVLAGLRDLEPALYRRLAATMSIALDAPAARTLTRADAKRALDATLHASAEELDVSAKRVRIAALALLSRITELGIDVALAQSLLAEGTSKPRA